MHIGWIPSLACLTSALYYAWACTDCQHFSLPTGHGPALFFAPAGLGPVPFFLLTFETLIESILFCAVQKRCNSSSSMSFPNLLVGYRKCSPAHEKESVNPKEPVNLLTTLCFCLGQRCRPALTPTTQAARTPWLTPTLARSQKRKSEPEDASSTYSMIDTETSKIPEKTVWAWRYNQTMTIKGLHVKQDPRKECLSLKIQPNRPGVPSIQSVGNIAFFCLSH